MPGDPFESVLAQNLIMAECIGRGVQEVRLSEGVEISVFSLTQGLGRMKGGVRNNSWESCFFCSARHLRDSALINAVHGVAA